jgi:hypothetical protein
MINRSIFWKEDAEAIEKEVHKRLKHTLVHASGEWYNIDYQLASRIIENVVNDLKGVDYGVWYSWRPEFDEYIDAAPKAC